MALGRIYNTEENLYVLSHENHRIQNLMYTVVIIQRRQWHPTPVLLPGKSHGWRSLVGCSPWGRLESDTTERLHFHFSLSRIGEGNGNPLQCSCLENPRDSGASWAAVYGVTQSRTRLRQLSSSSSSSSSGLINWTVFFFLLACPLGLLGTVHSSTWFPWEWVCVCVCARTRTSRQ